MNLLAYVSEQQFSLDGGGAVLIQTSMSDDAVRCYVVLKATDQPNCYGFKLNDNSRLLDMLRLKRSFMVKLSLGENLFEAMLRLNKDDGIELEILQQLKQTALNSECYCPHT